eukprot:3662722-Karenia_brevis.AAC.1
MSDASTTTLMQGAKVHAVKLHSAHILDADRIVTPADFFENCISHYGYADPQRQTNSKAVGFHALMLKQLTGLSCPL